MREICSGLQSFPSTDGRMSETTLNMVTFIVNVIDEKWAIQYSGSGKVNDSTRRSWWNVPDRQSSGLMGM